MSTKQVEAARIRRWRCIEAGSAFLAVLRAGAATSEQRESARNEVRAGMCPFCKEGSFITVAMHIQRIHGVWQRELREMVGFNFVESICDPKYSKHCAEINRGKDPKRHGVLPRTRGLSAAGRATLQANGRNTAETITPEQYKAMGTKGALAGHANKRRRKELSAVFAYRKCARCSRDVFYVAGSSPSMCPHCTSALAPLAPVPA